MKEIKIEKVAAIYNKGIFVLEIILTNGTSLCFTAEKTAKAYRLLNIDAECEYEIDEKNMIKTLKVDGKDLNGSAGKLKKINCGSKKTNIGNSTATAPYNFVPINKQIVTLSDDEFSNQTDKQTPNKFQDKSGYIDLEIENLTPLYIRDTYTKDELKKKQEDQGWVNSEFFSPAGIRAIPGSSLRGMVRTLLEIVSYSKMEFVEDKKLFFRDLGDTKHYQKYMLAGGEKGGLYPKTKAGWLRKVGSSYKIHPLKSDRIYRMEAKWNWQDKEKKTPNNGNWEIDFKQGNSTTTTNKAKLKPFSFHAISFVPAKEKEHIHRTKNNKEINLRYALVNEVCSGHEKAEEDNHYKKGYLVLTGNLGKKKHFHPIVSMPDFDKKPLFSLSPELRELYGLDAQRDEQIDVLDCVKDNTDGVPCFYLVDDSKEQKLSFFGHTLFFRLPYDKTVKDHLPDIHRNKASLKERDFAQTIFGDTENGASKVFFENAVLSTKKGEDINQYEELSSKILSSPKPTSFQLYLEQGNRNKKNLVHWGDAPEENGKTGLIRGYKLYWHRNTPDNLNEKFCWRASDKVVKAHSSQYTTIKPLKAGAKFASRIRFENLSKEELGALLFVLDLPENHCHKIGMGKPLGLGTIKIKPKLSLIARHEDGKETIGRYRKLFNGQNWYLGTKETTSGELDEYKNAFATYILEKTDKNKTDQKDKQNLLWNIDGLKELKTMLYFNEKEMEREDWLKATNYMEVEDFRKRDVLDKPTNIWLKK